MLTILAGAVTSAPSAEHCEPGQRLVLPVQVDGRLGHLEVSVYRFEALRLEGKNRRARPLGLVEFQRVCEAVTTAPGEHVRLPALAALVGLSPWQFSRSFHETAGMTFRAYVLHVRLDAAMRLMATTQQSLCYIAQASGFPDQAQFSRVFVRKIGLTPSKWRASAREGIVKSCYV